MVKWTGLKTLDHSKSNLNNSTSTKRIKRNESKSNIKYNRKQLKIKFKHKYKKSYMKRYYRWKILFYEFMNVMLLPMQLQGWCYFAFFYILLIWIIDYSSSTMDWLTGWFFLSNKFPLTHHFQTDSPMVRWENWLTKSSKKDRRKNEKEE